MYFKSNYVHVSSFKKGFGVSRMGLTVIFGLWLIVEISTSLVLFYAINS